MNKKPIKIILIVFAILAVASAIYHFVGFLKPFDKTPAWRHLLFVFIDLAVVYGCLKRPKWFIVFALVLTAQQLYSHGSFAITKWQMEHIIDWISVGVIVLLPAGCILLIADQRSRGSSSATAKHSGLIIFLLILFSNSFVQLVSPGGAPPREKDNRCPGRWHLLPSHQ